MRRLGRASFFLPMKRLALLIVVMAIVGDGASVVKHQAGRCHGLWGVARVCTASASSSPAQAQADRFAASLLRVWNGDQGAHGFPADLARCAPYGTGRDGLAVFACEWRVWWKPTKQLRCLYAIVDVKWNQYRAGWIKCRGVFAPGSA